MEGFGGYPTDQVGMQGAYPQAYAQMPQAPQAFKLDVGSPPQGKQGILMQKNADGSMRSISFNLQWPSLQVSCSVGDTLDGEQLLKNSVVHRRAQMDGPVDGKSLSGASRFCFQCEHRDSKSTGKTLTFFASSQQDCDEWCQRLRQHAVHHNLENGYEVSSKLLGSGAYAKVFQGRCKMTGSAVAVKIIPRMRLDSATHPADERKLLITEAALGQELRHAHCTHTTEFVENAHQYVIVMELMRGGDLFDYLARKTSLSENDTRCLTRQVLAGLHFMHKQNIAHFDIKPENFLLSHEKPMTVKLCDYGISMDLKTTQPSCYKTPGMLRASPGYGAPEVVKQQACGLKADMWSVGVCLYFCLTGRTPFVGKTADETQRLMISGQACVCVCVRVCVCVCVAEILKSQYPRLIFCRKIGCATNLSEFLCSITLHPLRASIPKRLTLSHAASRWIPLAEFRLQRPSITRLLRWVPRMTRSLRRAGVASVLIPMPVGRSGIPPGNWLGFDFFFRRGGVLLF
jgi:tRNA A-37 threonylcarbamoyl transferase component Bud32